MPASELDRIVLDTNVLVTAALNAGFERIIALNEFHGIQIYTCEKQLGELKRTLNNLKAKLTLTPAFYVSSFQTFSTTIEIDERFDRSPDPDDNYLFDLAYTAKSFYLVTQEKALLNLKQVNKIKIITFRELLKLAA